MKGRAIIMAQLAAAMFSGLPTGSTGGAMRELNDKVTDEDIRRRHIENLKGKGVKEYVIGGFTVYARNYKNALKKAERLMNHTNL